MEYNGSHMRRREEHRGRPKSPMSKEDDIDSPRSEDGPKGKKKEKKKKW